MLRTGFQMGISILKSMSRLNPELLTDALAIFQNSFNGLSPLFLRDGDSLNLVYYEGIGNIRFIINTISYEICKILAYLLFINI